MWRKGVAIPLRHKTIVSWDANILRHWKAILNITNDETAAFGTYFGIQEKVGAKLEVEKKSAVYKI